MVAEAEPVSESIKVLEDKSRKLLQAVISEADSRGLIGILDFVYGKEKAIVLGAEAIGARYPKIKMVILIIDGSIAHMDYERLYKVEQGGYG